MIFTLFFHNFSVCFLERIVLLSVSTANGCVPPLSRYILDEDVIQAIIEAIYDARADPTTEEEATAQFNDFVVEVQNLVLRQPAQKTEIAFESSY